MIEVGSNAGLLLNSRVVSRCAQAIAPAAAGLQTADHAQWRDPLATPRCRPRYSSRSLAVWAAARPPALRQRTSWPS